MMILWWWCLLLTRADCANVELCKSASMVVTSVAEILSWIIDCLRLAGTSGGPLTQPTLFKLGYLELVAQDHIQMAFEYPQWWRVHNISGQPVPMIDQSPSQWKSVSCVQMKSTVFQFATTAFAVALTVPSRGEGSCCFTCWQYS